MTTPRELADAESSRRGRLLFVAGCVALVAGDYADRSLIAALAPRSSPKFFDGHEHFDVYWFRVWGMRGLLWVWSDAGVPAVLQGLGDEHWRVREMAAKVAARHIVDEALAGLTEVRGDPVPRVRAAAERALVALTGAG